MPDDKNPGDLKPDNVLLDREHRPHVADFGLACLDNAKPPAAVPPVPVRSSEGILSGALHTPLTAAGVISGTPGYMSPEQYRGAPVDSRSDQFSFCVALYEALYGQLPFSGTTVAELAAKTIAGQLPAPPANSLVPPEIRTALLRGLAVAPEARFSSMAELLAAFELDERSPARDRTTRRGVSLAILIGCGMIGVAVRNAGHALTPSDLAALSGSALGLFVLIYIAFYRALRRNPFIRDFLIMGVTIIATLLALRILCWRLGLLVQQIFPIDLLVMGGLLVQTSFHTLKDLRWAGLVMAACAAFEAYRPQDAATISPGAYAVLPLVIVIAWMRAARKA